MQDRFLTCLGSRLIRPLSLRCDPSDMSSSASLPIDQWRMASNPVIPHHNRTRRPSDTALDILREGHVVVQELEKVVALFLLEANDVSGELWIDVQRFLPSCRMSSDYIKY